MRINYVPFLQIVLIGRRRPWPIHVACLTNISDMDIVNVYSCGLKGSRGRKGELGEIFQQQIPHTNRGTYQKDTLKALGSRAYWPRRPWPIHVACLTNISDNDIVNWSAGHEYTAFTLEVSYCVLCVLSSNKTAC